MSIYQRWVNVEVIPRKTITKRLYISASTNVNEMERITRLEWGQEDQDMSQGKDNEEQPRWRRERRYKVTLLVESGLDETLDTSTYIAST